MSERRVLVKRTFGYAALPLLSTLTPFLVLPVISRAATTGEWSALAVGQSIGLVAGLVVGYGWPVVGPPRAAQLAGPERRDLYAQSLASRLVILAVVAPVVAVIAWFSSPAQGSAQVLCVLIALGQSMVGLSISWYCIGIGAPAKIARFEVLPRAVSSVAAAGLILLTGWLWLYPLALVLSVLGGVAAFTRLTLRGPEGRHAGLPLRDVLRRQTAPTLIEVSAGSYTMGGGFLASLVTGERQIAEYGSADRLNQVALQAIAAVGNALNPWVAESEGAQFARRARLALGAHTALGAAGFLGLALLGPWASALLFGERLAVGAATCAAFGVYFFLVSLQTALARHILVSRGRVRVVLVATLCGAGIGVPSVILGAHLFGATGAASGLAFGEGVICLVLAVPAAITVRRHRDRPTGQDGPGPVADALGEVWPG